MMKSDIINYIAHIDEMIEKEKDHIKWLEKCPGNIINDTVLKQSKEMLEYYQKRKAEYEQYKNDLP